MTDPVNHYFSKAPPLQVGKYKKWALETHSVGAPLSDQLGPYLKTLEPKQQEELFTNIHLDPIASGTPHEGISPQITVDFLRHFLKGDQDFSNKEVLLRDCEQLAESMRLNPIEIAKRLQSLKKGESYAMAGRWRGLKPHAFYYHFRRRDDHHYDITIYNLNGFTISSVSTEKHLDAYTICFQKVHKQHLFVGKEGADLFASLKKLESDKTVKYSFFDIYKCLGEISIHYPQSTDTDQRFKTPQRSGTCSWRSLQALIQSVVKDEKTYKDLIFRIKQRSLVAYFEYWSKSKWTRERIYFLKRGVETLFRDVEKWGRVNKFDELSELRAKIDGLDARGPSKIQLPKQKDNYSIQKFYPRARITAKSGEAVTKPNWMIRAGTITEAKDPASFLEQRIKELKAMCDDKARGSIDPLLAADHLIDNFPIPGTGKCFWKELSPDMAKACLPHLGELAWWYTNVAHDQGYAAMPRAEVNIFTLYTIAYQLTTVSEPKLMSGYGVSPFLGAERLLHLSGLIIERPDLMKRYKRATLFLYQANAGKKTLFDFNSCFGWAQNASDPPIDVAFHLKMLQLYPDLVKGCTKPDSRQPVNFWKAWQLFAHFGGKGDCFTSNSSWSGMEAAKDYPAHMLGLKLCAAAAFCVEGAPDTQWHVSSKSRPINVEIGFGRPCGKIKFSSRKYSWSSSRRKNASLPTIGNSQIESKDIRNSTRRSRTGYLGENAHLISRVNRGDEFFFASNHPCSEPKVQISTMIAYLRRNAHFFEKRDHRLMADMLLFTPRGQSLSSRVDRTNSIWVPLFQTISDDVVWKQWKGLMEEGLKLFWKIQPGKVPKLEPACYFIRLSHKLRLLRGKGAPPLITDDRKILRQWLQMPEFTGPERGLLYFHLVSSYRAEGHTHFSEREWIELLKSWILSQQEGMRWQNSANLSFEDARQVREVTAWVASLEAPLKKFKGFAKLFNSLAKEYGLKTPAAAEWKCEQFPLVKGQEGYWIDLAAATFGKGGDILSKAEMPFEQFTLKRLFGRTNIQGRRLGRRYLFQLQPYGNFEITETISRRHSCLIWHRNGEEWILDQKRSCWNALQSDHSAWYEQKSGNLYFVPNRGRDPRFTLKPSGELCLSNDLTRALDSVKTCRVLDAFEIPKFIIRYRKAGSETIDHYSLPRYRLDGRPLRLIAGERGFHLPDQPNYVLSAPPLNNPLEGVGGVLYFRNQSHWRVLLPKEFMYARESFRKLHYALPPPDGEGGASSGEFERLNCMLVPIAADGNLAPSTVEERLFCSYLYQMQGDYRRAYAMLQGVSISTVVTKEIKACLEWIIWGHEWDVSGNANAIRLHAYLLLKRLLRDSELKLVDPAPPSYLKVMQDGTLEKFLEAVSKRYRELKPWVYQDLLLSEEQEKSPHLYLRDAGVDHLPTSNEFKVTGPFWGDKPFCVSLSQEEAKAAQQQTLPQRNVQLRSFHCEFIRDYRILQNKNHPQHPSLVYRFLQANFSGIQQNSSKSLVALLWHAYREGTWKLPEGSSKGGIDSIWIKRHIDSLPDYKNKNKDKDTNPWAASFEKREWYSGISLKNRKPYASSSTVTIGEFTLPRDPAPKLSEGMLSFFKVTDQGAHHKKSESPFANVKIPKSKYHSAVTQEMERYQREWTQGNLEPPRLVKVEAPALLPLLERAIYRAENIAGTLAKELLNAVEPSDKRVISHNWGRDWRVEIDDLIFWDLAGEAPFKKYNPQLTSEQIKKIREGVARYLEFATESQHLLRAESAIKANEPAKAFQVLGQARCYEPKVGEGSLSFEYFHNIRIRPKQYALITKSYTRASKGMSGFFQLMPGMGKTSVILMRLSRLIALQGKATLFLTHHSQWASSLGTIFNLQKRSYQKDVVRIDYPRSALARAFQLKQILKDLHAAKKNGWPILMQPRMLQLFEIEFLIVGLHQNKLPQGKERLRLLGEILRFLKKETVALVDEVDQVLNVLTGVNIPIGSRQGIELDDALLLGEIYSLLLTDKELKNSHNLDLDRQADVRANYPKIIERLAIKLADYAPLRLKTEKADFRKDFIEFLKSRKLESSFRSYCQEMADRLGTDQGKAASLISLVDEFCHEVLPTTIGKSFNMRYGYDKQGKIVWYQGVDTPTPTTPGTLLEESAYLMQAVIRVGISERDIARLAREWTRAATFYASQENTSFDKTAEALEFKEITGVFLREIECPGRLQEATRRVNSTPELKLKVAVEKMLIEAGYYPEVLASNPLNMIDRIANAIGCSGTPWNPTTYHKSIRDHALSVPGTEGKILRLLIKRIEEGRSQVFPLRDVSVAGIVEKIQKHRNLGRLQGLIDVGGLFRDLKTKKFIDAVLQVKDKGKGTFRYTGVLASYQDEDGTTKFGIYKRGLDRPLPLPNLSRETIAQYGIPTKKLFALFDQLRATGTDIYQSDNAINLVTLDPVEMDARSLGQGVMRLRKLFGRQDVDYLIPKASWKGDFSDLIVKMVINQGHKRAKQDFRTCQLEIEAVVRRTIIDQALSDTLDFQKVRPLLVKQIGARRSAIFPKPDQPPLIALRAFADQSITAFKQAGLGNELDKRVEGEINQLFGEFKRKHSLLPSLVPNVGHKESRESQIEVETNQEMQQENETAQENELQQYQLKGEGKAYKEKPWADKKTFSDYLEHFIPLHDNIKKRNQKDAEFAALFPKEKLLVTKNFLQVDSYPRMIFDKRRKPACHFLLYDQQVILISLKDRIHFEDWIKRNKADDVRLFNVNGVLIAGPKVSNQEKSEVERAVWLTNLYQGNFTNLLKKRYHFYLEEWFVDGMADRKRRYLTIRSEETERNHILYRRSPLLNRGAEKNTGIIQCRIRKKIEKSKHSSVATYNKEKVQGIKDPNELHYLAPGQVKWCTKNQVKWLKKKLHLRALSDEQMRWVKESQVPLLPPGSRFRALPKKMWEHLDPKQMPHLPTEWILGVKPKLFEEASEAQIKYYFEHTKPGTTHDPRLQHLSKPNISLVPKNWLSKLKDWQLLYVAPERATSFTAEDWGHAAGELGGDPERIARMKILVQSLKDPSKNLPTTLYKYLKLEQILTMDHSKHLTADQWQKIESALEANNQSAIKWLSRLPQCPPNWIPYLDKKGVQKLTKPEDLFSLSLLQADYLDNTQKKILNDLPKLPTNHECEGLPKLLVHLNRTLIPTLALAHVKHLTNIEHLFALTSEQADQLTPAQKQQIQSLNTLPKEHYCPGLPKLLVHFNRRAIQSLAIKYVLLLSGDNLFAISSEQAGHLTPEQKKQIKGLQQLPTNHECGGLPKLIPLLNQNAIRSLDKKHVRHITRIDQIFALRKEQLQRLTKDQKSKLRALDALPPNYEDGDLKTLVPFLKEEVILTLDPKYARFLTRDQWQKLVARVGDLAVQKWIHQIQDVAICPAEVVPHLSADQVGRLTGASLHALPSTRFNALKPTQFPHLTPGQVKQIKAKGMIEHLAAKQFQYLADAALPNVPLLSIKHLKINQIFTMDCVDSLIEDQWQKIESALKANNQSAIKWLSRLPCPRPNLIPYLDKKGVQKLTKPEDLFSLTLVQAGHLSDAQKKILSLLTKLPTNHECEGLPKLIPLLNRNVIRSLDKKDVCHITRIDQIFALRKEQLQHLTPNQKNQLRALDAAPSNHEGGDFKTLVPFLKEEVILTLDPKYARFLTRDQWQKLVARVGDLAVQKWIHQIQDVAICPGEVVPYLSADQVGRLTGANLHALPSTRFNALKPTQFPHLTPGQVKQIKAKGMIEHLAANQFQYLADAALPNVPLPSIKYLDPKQIRKRFLPGRWDRIQARICEVLDYPINREIRPPEKAICQTWKGESPSWPSLSAHTLAGALVGLVAMRYFPKATALSIGTITIASETLNLSNRSIDPKAKFAHRERIRALLAGLQLVALLTGIRRLAA